MNQHPMVNLSDRALISLCTGIYPDEEDRRKMASFMQCDRMRKSLSLIPIAENSQSILVDIGAATYWLPAYRELGYRRLVMVTKWPDEHALDEELIRNWKFGNEVSIQYADIDREPLSMEDESIDVVCSFELLEHLAMDPMFMIKEINRVLKPRGQFVLSTPNISGWRAASAALRGCNPNWWAAYNQNAKHNSTRHHREYTVNEVVKLAEAGGFAVKTTTTFTSGESFTLRSAIHKSLAFACIAMLGGSMKHRGTHVLIAAEKAREVQDRYPSWLYNEWPPAWWPGLAGDKKTTIASADSIGGEPQ